MKRALRCFVVLLAIFFVNASSIQAQEAFDIDDVNIMMDVHEDGRIDVVEKYNLDFRSYRHGFYRNIPNLYHMKWTIDDETVNKDYYFPIKDIKCSTQCSVEGNSNAMQVKLGDPDREIIGKQEYVISYTIQTKDLDIDTEGQMLYWNLVTDFDTTVKTLRYQIKMPKSFDKNEVYTYTGAFGEAGQNLTHSIMGNTIHGETLAPLSNNEAATIKVNLPKDYFTYPKPADTSWYGIGAGVVSLLVAGLLFLKFGKDDDVIITVEFQAPKDLDSASVGYVIDDMVDNKDILSLIIEWANKGFLKIHDEKDGFQIEKLVDMDTTNSKAYERTFFHALFNNGTMVSDEDLKNETVRKALMNSKSMLRNYYYRNKERRVFTNSSSILQGFMIFLIMIPSFIFTLATGYAKYEQFSIVFPYLIPSILLGISCAPWIFLMRKRYVLSKAAYYVMFSLMLLVNGVLICVTIFMQYNLGGSFVASCICGACQMGMVICMIFMDKRTPQGNRWLGQILGLKDFILSCEKDRLELLVNENPTAFFEVLPYAYVLGVSDLWVKKFEDIILPEPSWYVGYGYGNGNIFTTMLWWNHFHYCFNNISSAATYVPPATSGKGGGSFGSGGFGGGGFSGGGFGGGGGGSW